MRTEAITIRVPALPVAQPRQRHRLIKTKSGKQFIQNYSPKTGPATDFKATVRMAAEQAYAGAPLSGPVRCDLEFVFPRTSAMIWKKRPMPRVRHIKKPDRDNLDKVVMDSLKGLLWVDDSQVCAGEIQKWIAAGDEQPHVVITITEL